ncbi:MAG: hypothetical protein WA622_27840 [Mycobacterium sp.]
MVSLDVASRPLRALGDFFAPDGRVYTEFDLGQGAQQRTWQDMLRVPREN